MYRFAKSLIGGGLVVGVAALLWRPVVVPQVVKLPTDIDRTDQYAGTIVTYLDQQTGSPLAAPVTVPLTVDRHVTSVPGASGAHVSLLHETLTVHIGDQSLVEENVYAVDRRTMQNVSDPKAYTFAPGNVVDRSGTYYLTLKMGLGSSGESLRVWKPEAGTSYLVTSTSPATGTEAGTKVVYLKGEIPAPLPAPAYEVAALQARGLPTQLSAVQLAGRLGAAGVDVAALMPVLVANLSATELKAVTDALTVPVPLQYFVYGNGLVGAEPKTGGLVSLSDIVDGIEVQPVLTGLAPALAVLQQHTDVPAIASVVAVLGKLAAAPPQPVYEMRYTQTPASVADAGSYARSQADRVTLLSDTVPIALAVVAALGVLGGLAVAWFSRRRHPKATEPVEARPAEPISV